MKTFILITYLIFINNLALAKPGVYQINSLETSKDGELKPLYKLVKNATIIGVGESAHGSDGFLKARTKLIKGFVKDKGFRLILLESAYNRTEAINNYLQACHKKEQTEQMLTEALKTLAGIYSNTETKTLINWLCNFNKEIDNPVRFHGMDQWEDPWVSRELVRKGIAVTGDEDYKKLFEKAQRNCWGWQINDWSEGPETESWQYILETWRLPVENHRICVGSLYNLQRLMNRYQDNNSEEVFWINLALKVSYVYEMYRDLFVTDVTRALNLRDDLQAYLVKAWMDKYENKEKSIVLAHNIHISKKQSIIVPAHPGSNFKWVGVRSTGENLVAHYGRKYKSVAISGYEVGSSRDGNYVILSENDALDYRLSKLGDYLIVDPSARWIRRMGKWWLHNENDTMFFKPRTQYDAIFYVKNSPAATRLIFD